MKKITAKFLYPSGNFMTQCVILEIQNLLLAGSEPSKNQKIGLKQASSCYIAEKIKYLRIASKIA
ncbi:hypothetical protein L0337_23540 [candidate division KSB1 bacterium]|nr:hypothetical protein [candidate division KSB1 bacterium]